MATKDEENPTDTTTKDKETETDATQTLKEEAPSSPESGDGDRTEDAIVSKHKKTQSHEMLAQAAANTEDHLLKELAFARFIVRCPCALCLLSLLVLIIFCVIMGVLFDLSLEGSRQSFPDPPDQYVDDFDGYSLAAEFISATEEDEEANSVVQSEEIFWMHIQMFFELEDYNDDLDVDNPENTDYWILTPERIKTIVEYEDMVWKDQEWKDRFCFVGHEPMDSNYECLFEADPLVDPWQQEYGPNDAIISPARMIAQHYNYDYDSFTTADAKDYTLTNLQFYPYCFNPGAFETGQTWIYRSFLKAGAPIGNGKFTDVNGTNVPLSDYANAEDDIFTLEGGQLGEYYVWGYELYKDIIIKHKAELVDNEMGVAMYSLAIHMNYMFSALANSVIFLMLAIFVVWAYMGYHLQSMFLSSGAMLGILMSFPAAFFVYRVIFQIPIFDTLSTLIVFVLLGVGADDVFVLTDAWSQSAHFVPLDDDDADASADDPQKAEQKNIMRMSFAYRRAAMAMLVTQITTFFAFLATAASILINMSAFGIWSACVVMMNYFIVITYYPAVLMLHHKYIKKCEQKYVCCCFRSCKKPKKINRQLSRQSSATEVAEELGPVEKFLGTKYARFIINYKFIILGVFFVVFVLSCVGFAHIKTATQTDNAFTEDHWWVITQKSLGKFTASDTDSLTPVHVTFGIDGVDRDGFRKYRPDDYYGKVIWQKDFDISSAEQQSYLKFLCNDLKNQTIAFSGDDKIFCPIIDFEAYLADETSDAFPYVYSGTDMSQKEAFGREWARFLSHPVHGYRSKVDALTYIDDNYDIKFYAHWFYSTLVIEGFQIDGPVAEAFVDELEEYLDSVTGPDSDCPGSMCHNVGIPNIMWVYLSIIKGYISSAVKGILIALPLAFVVMIFSTQNWIVALFAMLDICGVMVSELAIMFLMGYEFSLTESIATIVIIGFSVDYVVHLANAYLESAAETRDQRISFSLLTIGISVVSGAVTTFLAGMFLCFAEFIFFKKMGSILMTTVLMSILWAMFFFTSLCAWIGPEHETGDLKRCWRCCKNKTKENKKEEKEMAIR